MTSPTETPPINTPERWRDHFPWLKAEHNKYDRGHVVILGGEWHSTGATKLAAYAALRAGAGLVSVACDARSLPLYAASFQAVMTKWTETSADFIKLIGDPRIAAILIGPAAGVTDHTRISVIEALAARKALVLDADALSVFSETPEMLFASTHASCIFTPHEGEFARLFGKHVNKQDDRASRVLQAARLSGAVIILKGAETLIAAPDGRIIVNTNAPALLATAGSGDVLAGICTGLLAQGMPPFESACAGVWLHSEAARHFGAGLIAEDIADQLPRILQKMYDER
jgi:hydroxyethylthiazole kinase-like uncharacterized protein yjeF